MYLSKCEHYPPLNGATLNRTKSAQTFINLQLKTHNTMRVKRTQGLLTFSGRTLSLETQKEQKKGEWQSGCVRRIRAALLLPSFMC